MSSYIAAFVLGILIYEWLQRGAAGAEAVPTSQGYRYPAGKPFRILWTGAVMIGVLILVLAPWTNDRMRQSKPPVQAALCGDEVGA